MEATDQGYELWPRNGLIKAERSYMAQKYNSFGSWEHTWSGYRMTDEIKNWLRENVGAKHWRYSAASGRVTIYDADKAALFKLRWC